MATKKLPKYLVHLYQEGPGDSIQAVVSKRVNPRGPHFKNMGIMEPEDSLEDVMEEIHNFFDDEGIDSVDVVWEIGGFNFKPFHGKMV